MITAIFNPGDKSITTEKLLQWDYGQVLSIKGLDLPKAVEIHFCVYTDTTTITTVGITTDDHTDVEIPDGLLRQERELRAYVYVADLEQGKTVRTVNIPIQGRQKPEIPHTPEDAEVFREAIKAVNDSADRAETAANTSEKNAKKTAEDRKAIEEMVETVSGIEQQVQDVKKYAGQAETAASNAALSEREAKEAKTAALQAKADAETARGIAETAAGKTAEDRTTVERAKEEVLQAKQQVSTDRAAVETVERKVAQMGNTIPQAVQAGVQEIGSAGAAEKQGIVQAGTEQKSAVESVGTKAVEDINLAKKTAIEAVETAKTGAVGAVGTAGTEQTKNVTAEGEKQVKAVADKGAEVLQSIPEDFVTQMESKLDKQQGVENNGKILGIGEDGLVVPVEKPSGGSGGDGIPIINTMSGTSPLAVTDSAERVNKGLSIIGNTVQNQDPPPSPDNQQEIKNVGKWNEVTQKYEVDVRVTGKNLIGEYNIFDSKGIDASGNVIDKPNACISDLIMVQKGQYHTLSLNNVDGITVSAYLYDRDRKYIGYYFATKSQTREFAQDENCFIRFIFPKPKAYILSTDIQLELRKGNSSYEPQRELQTLTLTSERPITKWDKLAEKDGEIGWLYKHKNITLNGGETWKIHSNNMAFYTEFADYKFQNSFCDKYKHKFSAWAEPEYGIYSDNNNAQKYFRPPHEGFEMDIDVWKAFLNNNPLTVICESMSTEFVPLQQSEQDAIRALKTYYPTTVITVDGGEVVPTVELTYTADTKNFILNREKVMQAQMLNIQSALISQKISGGGIKVTDSSRLPVEEFVMQGKMEQMQTTGAQLFDLSGVTKGLVNRETGEIGASGTYVASDYINVDPQNKYSISNFAAYHLCYYGHDKTFETTGSGSSVFVVPENAKYIRFSVTKEKIKEVIFCKGERLLPYEPYTGGKPSPRPDYPQPIETTPQGIITVDFTDGTNHQTIELNCPREFTKWDKLQKIDGVWNWVFGSKKVMLNGSEVWSKYADDFVYTIKIDDAKPGYQRSYCDKFKNVDAAFSDKYKSSSWIHSDHPTLKIKYFRAEPSVSTVELWKEWLSKNKAELIYEVDEPELVPLSQSEQDKLNILTMYAPNTEVTNTGGCNMELTYTVDTKSYVDAKIAPVVKTILETQKALL